MMCPHCQPYGMNGLVPVITSRPPEEQALPLEQRPPVQVIWVPCHMCIGGVASCCDPAGENS